MADAGTTAGGAKERRYVKNIKKIMKKACFQMKTSLFGGDKRDRTADLMTASCDRFVISGDFEYNTSVPPAKSAGFCKVLSIASTRFRAHLGHNLGQGTATARGAC